jgi:hypothetical protein
MKDHGSCGRHRKKCEIEKKGEIKQPPVKQSRKRPNGPGGGEKPTNDPPPDKLNNSAAGYHFEIHIKISLRSLNGAFSRSFFSCGIASIDACRPEHWAVRNHVLPAPVPFSSVHGGAG